jgi:hypothetical protein
METPRPNAHGLAQEELDTRFRPEQVNELSSNPDLNLDLDLLLTS